MHDVLKALAGVVVATIAIPARAALVLHYKLDETSGSTAIDSGPNGLNGTYNGAVTHGAAGFGDGGTGVTLTGTANDTSQYIITPNVGSYVNTGDNSISHSIWFKAPAEEAGVLVTELGSTAPNTGWHDSQLELLSSGNVKSGVWDYGGGTATSTATAAANVYHNAVTVYDGTAQTITNYLDGVATSTIRSGPNAARQNNGGNQYYALGPSDDTSLAAGGFVAGSSTAFQGTIDDYQLFNNALSATDVAAIYAAGVPEPTTTIALLGGGALLLLRRRQQM